ncbi:hypothetical protein V2J09_016437 [Rumex salicifolius]
MVYWFMLGLHIEIHFAVRVPPDISWGGDLLRQEGQQMGKSQANARIIMHSTNLKMMKTKRANARWCMQWIMQQLGMTFAYVGAQVFCSKIEPSGYDLGNCMDGVDVIYINEVIRYYICYFTVELYIDI